MHVVPPASENFIRKIRPRCQFQDVVVAFAQSRDLIPAKYAARHVVSLFPEGFDVFLA